jgi:5-methylcytosine-specific restriction endonuclease McrA
LNIERTKFKQKESQRGSKESNGRIPTDSQKREVFLKAQGVCEKCGGIFNLQYDHRTPFALGGRT